jgi:hypothetical protein
MKTERVGIRVSGGVVIFSGSVQSYFEKTEAETVAHRVGTVKAVVDLINVKFDNPNERGDQDMAKAIINACSWNFLVS